MCIVVRSFEDYVAAGYIFGRKQQILCALVGVAIVVWLHHPAECESLYARRHLNKVSIIFHLVCIEISTEPFHMDE